MQHSHFNFHLFVLSIRLNYPAKETSTPQIKLEPARSFLHPGDSIVVDCQSSTPESQVEWKREGDRRLPSNFHVSVHLSFQIESIAAHFIYFKYFFK